MQVFISSFILVSLFSIVKMSDGIISKVEGLKINEGTKDANPQTGSDTIGGALQIGGDKIPCITIKKNESGEATILDVKNIPFVDEQEENSDDSTLKATDNEKPTFAEIFGGKGVVNEDLSDISDAEETSDSASDEQDAKEKIIVRDIATESKELSSSDSDEQDAKETTTVGAKGTESKETDFKIPCNVSSG